MGSDRYVEQQMAHPQQLADANREIVRLKAENERLESMLRKLDAMPATNIDLKDAVRAKLGRQYGMSVRAAAAQMPCADKPPCVSCGATDTNRRPMHASPHSTMVCDDTTSCAARKAARGSALDDEDRAVMCPPSCCPATPSSGKAESLPFAKGSDTSEQAADSMASKAAEIRERVFKYVSDCGPWGSTCDMAEQALGLSHQTCSARFNELHNRGRFVDSGARRLTRSGRKAVVYTVKP